MKHPERMKDEGGEGEGRDYLDEHSRYRGISFAIMLKSSHLFILPLVFCSRESFTR